MKNSDDCSYNPNSILVTGCCGFIGTNFVKYVLKNIDGVKIFNLDLLTYAGNPNNLNEISASDNYKFFRGNIENYDLVSQIIADNKIDTLINFAAESHVDRSIENPNRFFKTNVGGTLSLLRAALEHGIKRFVQISTDEVYGSLGKQGLFTEETPLQPNSPYSASKASADHFVMAFNKTYDMNTVITRCSNNYGPYQFPEKLIPLVINNIHNGKEIPIYGDGQNIRDWIYVDDHCRGIWAALTLGSSGEVYNFGGNCELTNLVLVKKILNVMDASESLIKFVEDRKGHDYRYAIDSSKSMNDLGWSPESIFEDGIKSTIKWYQDNISWLNSVNSGAYINYESNNK